MERKAGKKVRAGRKNLWEVLWCRKLLREKTMCIKGAFGRRRETCCNNETEATERKNIYVCCS